MPGHRAQTLSFPSHPAGWSQGTEQPLRGRPGLAGLPGHVSYGQRLGHASPSLSSWDKPALVLWAFLMPQPSSRQLQTPLSTPDSTPQRPPQGATAQRESRVLERGGSLEGCSESPSSFCTSGVPAPCPLRRRWALGCPVPVARSLQEAREDSKFSTSPVPTPVLKTDQPLRSSFQNPACSRSVPLGVDTLYPCIEHLLYTHAVDQVHLHVAGPRCGRGLAVGGAVCAVQRTGWVQTLAPVYCATWGKFLGLLLPRFLRL